MASSVCLFSALMSAIERTQVELMELMEMGQKAAETQADAMLRKLEQENKELQRRVSALEELAQSDDFTHCVKVGEASVSSTKHRGKFRVNHVTLSDVSLAHPPSTRPRLVCSVHQYLSGNKEYLQKAGSSGGEIQRRAEDSSRKRFADSTLQS